MKEFDNLVGICKKSLKLCPWAKEQGVKGYANEVKLEADELIEAVMEKSKDDIQEELGDVINDCVHLALAAKIPIEDVLKGSVDKINRRKPFLAEGKEVTMEEAKRVWEEKKIEERHGKTK